VILEQFREHLVFALRLFFEGLKYSVLGVLDRLVSQELICGRSTTILSDGREFFARCIGEERRLVDLFPLGAKAMG
jgi:hypothetical protein